MLINTQDFFTLEVSDILKYEEVSKQIFKNNSTFLTFIATSKKNVFKCNMLYGDIYKVSTGFILKKKDGTRNTTVV
jgi:hypothetical protein